MFEIYITSDKENSVTQRDERRSISDEDIIRIADALAPRLVEDVKKTHHDFWIDPESHYQDHQKMRELSGEELYDIKNLVRMMKAAKSLWFKAFIGFAIIGSLILAGLGIGLHK